MAISGSEEVVGSMLIIARINEFPTSHQSLGLQEST